MDNFFFWKKWTKDYQLIFFLSFGLLLLSAVFLIYTSLSGIDFVGGWGSIQELTTIPIDFQKFTNHYHEFKIEIINYLVYEKYTSTLIEFNGHLGLVYVLFILLGFTLFMTISTTMSKYLYYGSMLAAMLFLATLNLDLLHVFNSSNKILLTLFVVIYGGISYAIYNFFDHLGIVKRLLIFGGTTAILMVSVYILSPLDNHSIHYHIAGYSSASLIVLTGLFIIYIGIENSLTLLYLNSNNRKGSLITYIVLNLLYLTVLILKIFYNTDIYGINEYTLIIFASIFTVWGTLKRNEDNQLGDTVARVLLVTVIGAIVLATIGFHSANQNSSLLSAIRKEIYIISLGYGGMFFLYVMVNFIGLLHAKKNVYKIVFQPTEFTVFRMYVLGIIASLALFAYKHNKKPYFQAISGYYNAVADSYYMKEDLILAAPFYQYAKNYDAFNNKSNVALANVEIKKENLSKAIELYKYAIAGGGNEQAYIQLANIYSNRGDYFDALFTLKEGVKRFPKSYMLYNNLGLTYKKSSLNDSTLYYFSKSIDYSPNEDYTSTNNLITFLLKKGFNEEGKELIETIESENHDLKTKAAISAYNARNGIFNQWNKTPFEADSTLTIDELAYLYNHFLNNLSLMDSSDLNVINKTLEVPDNIFNYEPLTTLKAFFEYYNGDPTSARDHMASLGSGTSFYSGYFNHTLGLWMLLHENYNEANKYFSISDRYQFQGGKFNHAFTESLLGNKDVYDSLWIELGKGGLIYRKSADKNLHLDSLTDFEKLVSVSIFNREITDKLITSIRDEKIKNLIFIEKVKLLIEEENVIEAQKILDEIKSKDDLMLENLISLFETEILIKTGDYEKAAVILNEMNAPIELRDKALYLKALLAEKIEKEDKINHIYKTLAYKYPFYEPGLIAYSKYLSTNNKIPEAYEIAVHGVKYLPKSIELLKLYTLLSVDEGLINYAEEGLNDLKKLLPADKFDVFEAEYSKKLATFEQKFNEWE